MKKKEEKTSEQKLLERALERYQTCSDVMSEIVNDAIDDIKFSSGAQWDSRTTADRRDRPCLVENRINGMVNKVVNTQRQNRTMIRVTARDENTDVDTAEVINGLLRFIQYNSDSETAIDTASNNQVRGGLGWLRVCTDYKEDESFEQEVRIERIKDLRQVKMPLHLCNYIDMRDAPYCFVETTMSKEAFEMEYPEDSLDDFDKSYEGWITDDQVKIAEYFEVEKKPLKLYKFSDGTISKEIPLEGSGIEILDERTVFERKIKWYKITSNKILEQGVFPGKWLPIVPVVGDEICIDGKTIYLSLVRNSKDPQRMLNYWRSAEAERIALAPKAKWVMYEGQDEGHELEWLESHKSNSPVLHARIMTEGGNLIPLPSREAPIPIDSAIVNAAREAIDAIKATSGIYDASLGAKGNETSGRAINARQREGDTANYHFVDNISKALRQVCRIIVDIIPEVYDTPRSLRILGEDMKEKIVRVNELHGDENKLYDLTVGSYDVIAETGPSYMSKRQEAADNIAQLGNRDPIIVSSTRDLLLKYLDMPSEVVERARKTIDPALLKEDDKQDPNQVQQQLQQASMTIQQLDQVVQKLQQENEQLEQQLNSKMLDNDTKLKIAEMQAQVDVLIQQMKNNVDVHKIAHSSAHELSIESMRQNKNMQLGENQVVN